MNKRYVVVAWIITVDNVWDFCHAIFKDKSIAETNAEMLRIDFGKHPHYVKWFDVEIVEVEL